MASPPEIDLNPQAATASPAPAVQIDEENRDPVARQDLNAPESYVPRWIPKAPPKIDVTHDSNSLPSEPLPADDVQSVSSLIQLEQEGEEEDDEQLTTVIVEGSPPWLISLVAHMILIVILGLIAISQAIMPSIDLEVTFADSFGEQMEYETFEMSDVQLDDKSLVTPEDLTEVEDPLSSPHSTAPELPSQLMAMSAFEAPNVGLALSGREQGMKETLLLAYGGSKITEQAVFSALQWLDKQQQRDGSWRLDGPYEDASTSRNDLAATSMALLAFQGAGFTPNSSRTMITDSAGGKRQVDYRRLMQRGWSKMLEWQDQDGAFWTNARITNRLHKLYSQAQATIAICELYGMTKDEKYRRPAQLAVNYACAIQADQGRYRGGWKYEPGENSDLSVTGWFVMALQSARMAGLDVPSDVWEKIEKFLDSVTDEGSYYKYEPGFGSKPAMTAEGLLCRQYMGWDRDDRRLVRGVEYLAKHPIDWSESNTYYWYYATQVMHHMEGDVWFEWNDVMSKEIPAKQVKKGPEKGSWSPAGTNQWSQFGGRLYQTCMCTYMLEVYYRHLPIYAKLF